MTVRLLQEAQITLESVLALESLNLLFHDRDIGRQFEVRPIVEMYIVVGIALDQMNTFVLQRRAEIRECFLEQLWQKKQTGSLVESL
jgi:hypothetical protein